VAVSTASPEVAELIVKLACPETSVTAGVVAATIESVPPRSEDKVIDLPLKGLPLELFNVTVTVAVAAPSAAIEAGIARKVDLLASGMLIGSTVVTGEVVGIGKKFESMSDAFTQPEITVLRASDETQPMSLENPNRCSVLMCLLKPTLGAIGQFITLL
jgi:hypothetical protein